MEQLFILNFLLILIISLGLWLVKRFVKSERTRNVILIVSAVFTVCCHYSSLLYHYFLDGSAMDYLRGNPNLILPIYPCNVVMWCSVIYGFLKDKLSKFAEFLADYIFWFGIVSTLVGMFANVDFVRNPTLADFDVTKGIVSHATLLFNVLLLPIFGRVKVNVKRNITNILISILMMLVIGLYCNLVFHTLVSEEMAFEVNSMFLIHSPFAGIEFLTYPIIALIAIPLYFGLFLLCDLFAHKKGERFYNRFSKWIKERIENK